MTRKRLQIKELDEWQTQKSRTLYKPKLSQDKLNTSLSQLKVGDKVLLDAAHPRIATPEPNEEIPLTILNMFPYGTVEVIHPKFGTFKLIAGMRSVNSSHDLDHAEERYKEPQRSSSHRNQKLHYERFSTIAMSYSTTTIATTRYNILLPQDLWTNEPLPTLEYPPPLSSLPWPIILDNSNSRSPFIIQEVSPLSLSYDYISILFNISIFVH
ncbi:hypothetical protein GOBAR_AA34353 [Gossypium barbadense]|uniref:Uncharacterized protein n=1 Tax=Gossypium barbadense TaxID=3634 RepID=A0A2P5W5J6_GOSBA|nr:hypothetical protein GOBAR_AA34353 [Gossypium barbadense]